MQLSSPMVTLYTRDIESAVRFYADTLGFRESFRTPTTGVPEHVELRLDGVTLGLATAEAAARVHGVEPTPGSPGCQLVLWCDDVDTAYDALVAGGVPGVTSPHDTGNGNRNALLQDPDGNLVEIVMRRR